MNTLIFVFIGTTSDWKPMKGLPASTGGSIFEVRSLPGNVVGLGDTPEEAETNLKETLDAAFAHEGSPEAWYRKAWDRSSGADRRVFGRSMVSTASELRGLKKSDGYEYASISGDMSTVGS